MRRVFFVGLLFMMTICNFSIVGNATMVQDLSSYVRRVLYFDEGISSNFSLYPDINQIASVAELLEIFTPVEKKNILTEQYDELFFEDSFLILIRQFVPSFVMHLQLSAVQEKNGRINIELQQVGYGPPMPGVRTVLLEMNRLLPEKEISVTIIQNFGSPYFFDFRDPPPSPTAAGLPTVDSITLSAIYGAEFRIRILGVPGVSAWQTSPVFTGLQPATNYIVHARFPAEGWIVPSLMSQSAVIRTAPEPPYFGDVPVTGIPNITGYIVAAFVFLAVSVASSLIAGQVS